MLNLAGSSYDFGNVLFAVLQECEHVRRSLLPNEAEKKLTEAARRKLAEIRESYVESGGTEGYWQDLEREVMETTLPQYIPAAIEQTRLEKSNYDLWRQGDVAARAAFCLLCLVIGALIVALPFIPIVEDVFVFILALLGFFYPDLKKGYYDYRHSQFLNKLIVQAERYQKNSRIHYVAPSRLEEELRSVVPDPEAKGPRRVEPHATEPGKEKPPTVRPRTRGR